MYIYIYICIYIYTYIFARITGLQDREYRMEMYPCPLISRAWSQVPPRATSRLAGMLLGRIRAPTETVIRRGT